MFIWPPLPTSAAGSGSAAWDYVRENAQDWAWVAVYYLGTVVPPLRRFAEPPEPLEGATAEEIETDEDAGGMGGGDGKLAAAIGANSGSGLALESWFFAIFLGAFAGLFVLLRRRRAIGERTAIPFGPAMVGGRAAGPVRRQQACGPGIGRIETGSWNAIVDDRRKNS